MGCREFELFVKGDITPDAFKAHMEKCSRCRASYELDRTILRIAGETGFGEENGEELWHRIEGSLRAGKKRRRALTYAFRFAVAAVVVAAVVSLFRYSNATYRISHARFLAAADLERVERIEQEYARAIEVLEESAAPNLASMDFELALLYKDKLKTIDEQIHECMEALNSNPGSGRIRRYMLAAMRDKKETLAEIARSGRNSMNQEQSNI